MRGMLLAGFLIVLLLGGVLVARNLDLLDRSGSEAAEPTEVSPEAARSAEAKIDRLASDGEEVRLTAVELTSLFRYSPESFPLEGVHAPSFQMMGDTLRLQGSVAIADLPPQPELDAIRYLLPDTAAFVVEGTLASSVEGTALLEVGSIEVAGMPIPTRFYPLILERLGGREPSQANSIPLPLPGRARSAGVENGELILLP